MELILFADLNFSISRRVRLQSLRISFFRLTKNSTVHPLSRHRRRQHISFHLLSSFFFFEIFVFQTIYIARCGKRSISFQTENHLETTTKFFFPSFVCFYLLLFAPFFSFSHSHSLFSLSILLIISLLFLFRVSLELALFTALNCNQKCSVQNECQTNKQTDGRYTRRTRAEN